MQNTLKNVFLSLLVGFLVSAPLLAQEALYYERFERNTGDQTIGHSMIVFSEDTVPYGGLKGAANVASVGFSGNPHFSVFARPKIAIPDTNFTVEAFVKLQDVKRPQVIAASWDEANGKRSWALVVMPEGRIRFDVSPDGNFHVGNKMETTVRYIAPGTWFHIAAVSEGDESRLYVNGKKVFEKKRQMSGILTQGAVAISIGNSSFSDTPKPLTGLIDEVRITNKALQPSEFLATNEPMPDPVAVQRKFQFSFAAKNKSDAQQWQEEARKKLIQLVTAQMPPRSLSDVPLDFRVDSTEDRGDYTLYKSSFVCNDKERRQCFVTIPKGKGDGPFPAMVCLHGHGGRAEDVFDRTTLYNGFADHFARGGYVVIAPSFPHRPYAFVTLWDLKRCVDILETRSEVDPKRIGVAGLSMGGEWTMLLAACDTRLRASVVSGWTCTTEGVFEVFNCPCWELPGVVELMDICEVHLLIAPRPLLIESAISDGCFPINHAKDAYRRIKEGYSVFGDETLCTQDTFPGGHAWNGPAAYEWINKYLGGSAK